MFQSSGMEMDNAVQRRCDRSCKTRPGNSINQQRSDERVLVIAAWSISSNKENYTDTEIRMETFRSVGARNFHGMVSTSLSMLRPAKEAYSVSLIRYLDLATQAIFRRFLLSIPILSFPICLARMVHSKLTIPLNAKLNYQAALIDLILM